MSSPSAALRQQALRWLAQREHSPLELRSKLQRWLSRQHADATAEVLDADSVNSHIDTTIDALEAAGWLNSERFVESRVRQRQSRFGNRRIQAELRQHGLQANPEQQALLASSEADRALQALTRRFGGRAQREDDADTNEFSSHPPGISFRRAETDEARRRPGIPSPAQRERLKQHRFLVARGFSTEAIQAALSAHAQALGSAACTDDTDLPDTPC